jgi:hypothetical protein
MSMIIGHESQNTCRDQELLWRCSSVDFRCGETVDSDRD